MVGKDSRDIFKGVLNPRVFKGSLLMR